MPAAGGGVGAVLRANLGLVAFIASGPALTVVNKALLDAGFRRPQPPARDCSLCCTPPLPLAGVSIWTERGCQQNDSLVIGYSEPALDSRI